MTFFTYFLPLVTKFFTSSVMTYFVYPLFALFFVITAPCIFHRFFRR